MTTDRELLEAAAKAAGVELGWDARGPYQLIPGISGNDKEWNPLTNDGDALRLAVKLKIDIKQYGDRVVAWFDGGFFGTGWTPYEDDPCAATRRAIVRAVAMQAQKE